MLEYVGADDAVESSLGQLIEGLIGRVVAANVVHTPERADIRIVDPLFLIDDARGQVLEPLAGAIVEDRACAGVLDQFLDPGRFWREALTGKSPLRRDAAVHLAVQMHLLVLLQEATISRTGCRA